MAKKSVKKVVASPKMGPRKFYHATGKVKSMARKGGSMRGK